MDNKKQKIKIKKLDLSNCQIEEKSIEAILNGIKLDNLENLTLTKNQTLGKNSFKKLTESLQSNKILKSLILDKCLLDQDKIQYFFSKISLQSLKLASFKNNNDIESDGWAVIGSSLSSANDSMMVINLEGCKLDDESLVALAENFRPTRLAKLVLRQNNNLKIKGQKSLNKIIKQSSASLLQIDISRCNLDIHKAQALFEGILTTGLQNLNLRQNPGLRDGGWKVVNTLLNYCTESLENLDISSCSLTNSDSISLFENVNFKNIKQLNLRQNPNLAEAGYAALSKSIIQCAFKIKGLNLLDCSLTDSKVQSFFKSLQFKEVREVNLGDNPKLTEEGWAIANHSLLAQSRLESMNIWGCSLKEESINCLFFKVQLSYLTEFNLSGNTNISLQGWQTLNQSLKYSSFTLRKLHLNGCAMDDSKLTALINKIEFKELTMLNLGVNPLISALGQTSLRSSLKLCLSKIELMHFAKCKLEDDKVMALLGGVEMECLQELILGHNRALTAVGWATVNRALGKHPVLRRLDVMSSDIDDEKITALLNGLNFNQIVEINFYDNHFSDSTIRTFSGNFNRKLSDVLIM